MSNYYFAYPPCYNTPLEPPRRRWGLRRTSRKLKPSHYQPRPSVSASLFCHNYRDRSYHTQPYHEPHYTYQPEYPATRARKININSLPPELNLNIISNLDPVSSTCYGLSSRSIYPLHRSRHGRVGLYEQSADRGVPLAFKLRRWVGEGVRLDWETERFVRREQRRAEREKIRIPGWNDEYYVRKVHRGRDY